MDDVLRYDIQITFQSNMWYWYSEIHHSRCSIRHLIDIRILLYLKLSCYIFFQNTFESNMWDLNEICEYICGQNASQLPMRFSTHSILKIHFTFIFEWNVILNLESTITHRSYRYKSRTWECDTYGMSFLYGMSSSHWPMTHVCSYVYVRRMQHMHLCSYVYVSRMRHTWDVIES